MTNNLKNIQSTSVQFFEQSDICLFELSDSGTVLYCKAGMSRQSNANSAQAVGNNFFDEVKPFENTEELKPLLNSFIESDYATQKFNFGCRIQNRLVPAKIMLVRLPENSSGDVGKTTIVDIRKI